MGRKIVNKRQLKDVRQNTQGINAEGEDEAREVMTF
jgi:hypothetical protein